MPQAVAVAAISAYSGYAAGFTLFSLTAAQTALVSFAANIALSFASGALSGSSKKPSMDGTLERQVQDNTITLRQSAAPRKMMMGMGRAGGVYTFLHTTGSNNDVLHAVVTVTGHSVRGFDALYLDDEIVPLDANGNATGKYAGKIKCIFGLGTTDGDADFNAALTDAVGSDYWGPNHKQEGCAKAYIAFTFDNNLFGGSLPNASFVISGYDTVEDPRGSAGWTDNAALCIAQYLTDETRGMGFLAADIDQTALIAAANDCDEMVERVAVSVTFTADATTDVLTVADTSAKLRTGTRVTVSNSGGALPAGLSAATNYFWISLTPTSGKLATSLVNSRAQVAVDLTDDGTGTNTVTVNAEPRYTLNGMIDTSDEPDNIMPKLLSAMAGVKVESGGKVILLAGVWRAVTDATIDEQILDGGVSSSHRRGRSELFNGVKGTFVNPDDAWVPTDFPSVKPAAYLAEDGGVRSWRDAELPYTNSPSMAQRVARIDLEKVRRQQTVTMPLTLAGMTYRAGDNVAITNAKRGWTDKSFMVTSWALEPRDIGGDNPRIGVTISGDEIDATVYSWTPATDEAAMVASPRTNLPSAFDINPPGLTVTDVVRKTPTGGIVTNLVATMQPAVAGENRDYEAQYRLSTDTEYTSMGRSASLIQSAANVVDGQTYYVRARALSQVIGSVSPWFPDDTGRAHTVVGQTARPSDVTGFALSIIDGSASLSWDANSEVDISHYRIRYSTSLTGATWADSTVLVDRVSKPSTSATVPALVGSYLIKAVDYGGRESVNAQVISSNVAALRTFNAIESVEEAPALLGTHNQTFNDDGKIELDYQEDIFTRADFFEVSDFFLGTEGFYSEGWYHFENFVDLGDEYTSRVTADFTVRGENYNEDLFTRSNFFDVADFFGIDPSQYGAMLEIRTTDDTASSPIVWSDWMPFVTGDYAAAGLDFRMHLTSSEFGVTPVVPQLGVSVDMPDENRAENDLVVTTSGRTITFSPAFKALKGVGISAQGLAAGDYYLITNKSGVGFDIAFFDDTDTPIERTFDYVAVGYGRLI